MGMRGPDLGPWGGKVADASSLGMGLEAMYDEQGLGPLKRTPKALICQKKEM